MNFVAVMLAKCCRMNNRKDIDIVEDPYIMLLEVHCPAHFSSNPDQTHLPVIFKYVCIGV